jgi:hypothetical protein
MFRSTISRKNVERAADVLEIDEPERTKMHAFYHRERVQDREANIKLLKAVARVFFKCLVVALIGWAFLQTFKTERLPH